MRYNAALWLSGVVGAVIGSVFTGSWLQPTAVMVAQSALPTAPKPVLSALESFESIVSKVGPSVVTVDAIKPAVAGSSSKSKSNEESGSGVIVNFEGYRGSYVVTNNHVVSGAKPEEITITLSDGRIVRPTLVRADPESDIAILGIEAPNIRAAEFGDSDRVRVGQWVLAFGSPFGLNQSVTHGIISARDRGQISLGTTIRIKEFLQTDAAINPGSSGGPLVNAEGAVIGINTAIASHSGSNSGVAFSIPINLVRRVGRELLDKGYINRGYLGVNLSPVLEPAEALRLGLERVRGALVESVNPGSPAAIAGLRNKDVILKLENVELRDENHLINLVSELPPNHKVRLSVWRDRRLQTLEVQIGDWSSLTRR